MDDVHVVSTSRKLLEAESTPLGIVVGGDDTPEGRLRRGAITAGHLDEHRKRSTLNYQRIAA